MIFPTKHESNFIVHGFCLFHFFRNSQHPEKRSVNLKNLFRKCECISYNESILKFTNKVLQKNFPFCAYCDRCYGKNCSVSSIFQTIVVIVLVKIREKYLGRGSLLERNFQKLFVDVPIQDFNHKFLNTFFLKNSPSILVNNK